MSMQFGATVTLSARFTDKDENLVDPTSVECIVLFPDGTNRSYTSPDVKHDGVGLYHLDLLPDQAGTFAYGWRGTGPLVTLAGESQFLVAKSKVFGL